MMNMMTGAVAINGGVGVMEIRQPKMAEVVEQVSTVAADVAQNAHITLRELKEKIDAVVEQKLPTFKTLMEQKPVAVAQTTVNDASLTVYENGYAVYEVDGAHTVMAVERCGDCRYDFTDGTYQIIPAEEFENMEWSIRLLMEGERRMEHNRNKTSDKFENTALECDGSDWSAAVMVDFMDDCKAEVLADKELKRLYEPAVEDDVNSGSSLEQPATESDSAENDSADGETADSDFPVDDADALPWNEDTGQKDTAPAEAEPKAGYTDIYKTELISLTEFEKLMGKKKFQEILGEYVAKPPGKLTLVPDSDPRQAVDLQTAEDEFTPLD